MITSSSARASAHRIFHTAFVATDVAECLVSYDAEQPADRVRERMIAHDFDAVGVRDDGIVVGYVLRDDLTDGVCADPLRYFGSDDLLTASASLSDAVLLLADRQRVFVTSLGAVAGIVTPADLQKPAMRMWLFGLIAVIEETFTLALRLRWPNDQWKEHISKGRLKRALDLQEERKRRNQSLELVDCLAFADKGQILLKDPEVRRRFGVPSASEGKKRISDFEKLRNTLAHSQDITTESWPTVIRLAERLDRVLKVYDMM